MGEQIESLRFLAVDNKSFISIHTRQVKNHAQWVPEKQEFSQKINNDPVVKHLHQILILVKRYSTLILSRIIYTEVFFDVGHH